MIWLPDFSKDSTVCERYKGRGLGGGKDHSGRVEPPGASAAEMKLFLILLLATVGVVMAQRDLGRYTAGRPISGGVYPGIQPFGGGGFQRSSFRRYGRSLQLPPKHALLKPAPRPHLAQLTSAEAL
ncbi:uncharacterized protein [Penaeus vannamei]|uniref:uncharacterized protein n=1 Tax=Penaeus vannamei TaxID=6689 RepID=UPI00387F7B8A